MKTFHSFQLDQIILIKRKIIFNFKINHSNQFPRNCIHISKRFNENKILIKKLIHRNHREIKYYI